MPLPQFRADMLAGELDIDLDIGICHACLSVVSFALDDGNPAEIRRRIRRLAPNLWADGLAEPALAAVRRAAARGVSDAAAALIELEQNGGASSVARAIVRRLAEELSRRTRTELYLATVARQRFPSARPESN